VRKPVALAVDPGLVDEDPCVRDEAGDGRTHVLVQLEDLHEEFGVFQAALGGLVGCQDCAFGGGYAYYGSSSLHKLQGVLDLVEASFW